MCVGFAPRAIFGAVVGCIGVGGCVVVFGGVGWRLWGGFGLVGGCEVFVWLGLYVGALPQAPFFSRVGWSG